MSKRKIQKVEQEAEMAGDSSVRVSREVFERLRDSSEGGLGGRKVIVDRAILLYLSLHGMVAGYMENPYLLRAHPPESRAAMRETMGQEIIDAIIHVAEIAPPGVFNVRDAAVGAAAQRAAEAGRKATGEAPAQPESTPGTARPGTPPSAGHGSKSA